MIQSTTDLPCPNFSWRSAYRGQSLCPLCSLDISSALWLTSDLPGKSDSPVTGDIRFTGYREHPINRGYPIHRWPVISDSPVTAPGISDLPGISDSPVTGDIRFTGDRGYTSSPGDLDKYVISFIVHYIMSLYYQGIPCRCVWVANLSMLPRFSSSIRPVNEKHKREFSTNTRYKLTYIRPTYLSGGIVIIYFFFRYWCIDKIISYYLITRHISTAIYFGNLCWS